MSDQIILDMTHDQLIEQSAIHDVVLRAICLEHDCDYLAAIDHLEAWFAEGQLENAGKPVTLSRAVSAFSPIPLTRFTTDLTQLDRAAERHQVLVLALDHGTSPPEGEVDADGRVLLDAEVDRAPLLVHPYEVERAYLAAKDVRPEYHGDEGRRLFEQDHRLHLETGIDLVATLQLEQHQREAMVAATRAEQAQQRWEQRERAERARRRQARDEIHGLRKQL